MRGSAVRDISYLWRADTRCQGGTFRPPDRLTSLIELSPSTPATQVEIVMVSCSVDYRVSFSRRWVLTPGNSMSSAKATSPHLGPQSRRSTNSPLGLFPSS